MRIGEINVRLIGDGTLRLDGGAMFGVIPKPMWEQKAPADERNRILLAMNILLIEAAGKRILVETGAGEKWDAKSTTIYAIETSNRLPERLKAAGVRPEEIDIVINTHLHFDHCGGNTKIENGRLMPAFPRAKYIVQRGDFDHALAPTERDRASYIADNITPMRDTKQWELLNGDVEIVPGVELIVVPGHTGNMQCVKLSGGGQTAIFLADLVPMAAHLGLPWIMGFDLYPLTTLEQKKKWLPKIARENWTVFFAHDTQAPVVKLKETAHGFEATPVAME